MSLVLERAQTASQALTDDFRRLQSGFAEGRELGHDPLNARSLAVKRFAHPLQMVDQLIDLAHLRIPNILQQCSGIHFLRLTFGLHVLPCTDELSRPVGIRGRIARRARFAIGKTRIALDRPANFLNLTPWEREITRPAASLGQLAQNIALAICEKAHVPISYLQRRKRCGAPSPEMPAWECDQLAVLFWRDRRFCWAAMQQALT
jgi:hypothetical protein